MKTQAMSFSRVMSIVGLGTLLFFGVFYTLSIHAAQGCGHGYHMTNNGRCVPNMPGPNATPAAGRPNCWYNGNGNLRCF